MFLHYETLRRRRQYGSAMQQAHPMRPQNEDTPVQQGSPVVMTTTGLPCTYLVGRAYAIYGVVTTEQSKRRAGICWTGRTTMAPVSDPGAASASAVSTGSTGV